MKNSYLFYSFNNQFNYVLTYYFTKLETIKYIVNKFFINLLIKLIIKNFSHYNINK